MSYAFIKRPKKILVFSSFDAEGCVLYRTLGPFSLLKDEFDIQGNKPGEVGGGWAHMATADCVVLQASALPNIMTIIQNAKRMGIPVWIDYDDNHLCVPEGNVRYEQFQDEALKARINSAIAQADIVTVSTPGLLSSFRPLTKAVMEVIPNAWDKRFHGKEPNSGPRAKCISWRGMDSHQVDVVQYANAILAASRKHPELLWAWFGVKPAFLTYSLEKKQGFPVSSALDYFDSIKALAPLLHIVPLENCEFNHCKSNIAWIEATMAGAACLAPNFPEWQWAGAWNYENQETFLAGLEGFAGNPELAIEAAKISWETIQREFMVEAHNEKRREILRNLFK